MEVSICLYLFKAIIIHLTGVAPTQLYRHNSSLVQYLINTFPGPYILRNRKSAANDLLYLCLSKNVKHGAYYEHGSVKKIKVDASKEDKQLMWREFLDTAALSDEAENYWAEHFSNTMTQI